MRDLLRIRLPILVATTTLGLALAGTASANTAGKYHAHGAQYRQASHVQRQYHRQGQRLLRHRR